MLCFCCGRAGVGVLKSDPVGCVRSILGRALVRYSRFGVADFMMDGTCLRSIYGTMFLIYICDHGMEWQGSRREKYWPLTTRQTENLKLKQRVHFSENFSGWIIFLRRRHDGLERINTQILVAEVVFTLFECTAFLKRSIQKISLAFYYVYSRSSFRILK